MKKKTNSSPQALTRFQNRYNKFVRYTVYGTVTVIIILLIMFLTLV